MQGMAKRIASSCLTFVAAAALAVTLCGLFSTRAEGVKSVDETRKASPAGHVDINNLAGTVTVAGWDREEVRVTGTLADGVTLEFDGSGDRTRIETKWPERSNGKTSFHMNGGCELSIHVPWASEVAVRTVSADVDVHGIGGDLELAAVSGNVQVRPTAGGADSLTGASEVARTSKRIDAQTVSGNLDIAGPATRVKAQTVSGDLTVRLGGGDLGLNTVSGHIRVQGGRFENIEASAVSGDVLFEGQVDPDARCEMSSHSGDVELRLPGDVAAEFEVTTFSGDIVSQFGGGAERTSQYAPGKELSLTTGSGGARIKLDSFSGTVRLLKK